MNSNIQYHTTQPLIMILFNIQSRKDSDLTQKIIQRGCNQSTVSIPDNDLMVSGEAEVRESKPVLER